MTEKAKKLGNEHVGYNPDYIKSGITKREYYAGLALQAIITKDIQLVEGEVAHNAVIFADALLEELAK